MDNVNEPNRLRGLSAIVTGGAQGIGKAFALRFAQEGANVAIVDTRGDQAERVAEEVRTAGVLSRAFVADITDENAMAGMAEAVNDAFGSIDVLINNAAIHYDMQFRNQTIEYLKRVLEVNTLGALIVSRAVFPYMKSRRQGSIINISSTAAYQFVTSDAQEKDWDIIPSFQYSLSKAALIDLTKLMAGTVGKYGIRVNCLVPGLTITEAIEKNLPPALIEELRHANAMGVAMQPADIAGAAVFLATADSQYVTGQVIMIDGGLIMPA